MAVRGVDIKSRTHKADNTLSTLALYYYRLLYSVDFSGKNPSRGIKKSVTNFDYSERVLYGRVDNEMTPIMVHETQLRTLPADGEKTFRALDFVVSAFEDFQKAFKNAREKGQISPNQGFMTFPEAKSGYVSPTSHYMEYRTALFELFIEKIRSDKEANVKIKDFDSFLPYFDQFVTDATQRAPFTFSSYMRSKYSSVKMTGLAIELLELDASRDERKVEMVYDNPNYPFYENMAIQFGFSIDKNVPYRLIADLNSPAMQRYMTAHGYDNYLTVLKRCYRKAWLPGYNNFKSLYAIYYNSFVRFNPSVVSPYMKKNGKYAGKRTVRETRDLIELNKTYGEEWFLLKYAQVRNAEEGYPLSEARLKQVVKRANKLGIIKGKARCLMMINKNLVDTTRKSGSHSEKEKMRQETRDKAQRTADNAQRKPGSLSY